METDREYFPPTTRMSVPTRDLRTALQQADKLESTRIEILGYGASPSPWFCFDVGDLKYAIWRETGALYEVDEFGAVADDPISGPRAPRGG